MIHRLGTGLRRQHDPGELIQIIRRRILPELAVLHVLDQKARLFPPGAVELDGRLCFPQVA